MPTAPIELIQERYSQLDGPLPLLESNEAVDMVTTLLDEGYVMVAGILVTEGSMTLRGLVNDLRVSVGQISEDPDTVVGPHVLKACVMRDGTAFDASVMLDGSIGLWTRNTAMAA